MDEFFMITIVADSKVDNSHIAVSKDLVNTFGLEEYKPMSFFVGQSKGKFTVTVMNNSKNLRTISLSPLNLKKFYLKSGKKYGIRTNEDEIHLGPVVGIMIDVFNDPNRPFKGQTTFVKQLLASGNSLGQICFAFSPYSIDFSKRIVRGYTYGSKGWVKSIFPIPDVVYPRERAYTRSKLQTRKKLESIGVILLNSSSADKWETHKILMKNSRIKNFLPETRFILSFNEVEQMLRKHSAVYLKPIAGSQGKNIIKVFRRRPSGIYEYRYMSENRMIKGSASSLVNLHKSLRRIMGNRRYIVQEQIDLLKCEGNIIDVRVLVQKDHTGEWDVTGMACRVGKNGSIISNLSSGGSGRKIEEVLRRNIPLEETRERIMEDINFISIEAAKTLENSIGQCGEMGIDVGIDKDGKVWFIEANVRPARHVFNLIGEADTRLRSVERPMQYAGYLAGF